MINIQTMTDQTPSHILVMLVIGIKMGYFKTMHIELCK